VKQKKKVWWGGASLFAEDFEGYTKKVAQISQSGNLVLKPATFPPEIDNTVACELFNRMYQIAMERFAKK